MPFTRVSSRTDYRFPTGLSDLTGYEVRTAIDDEKAGKVSDTLVDESGEPRYLDVDLGFLQKHVLVPVGHASADPEGEVIRLPGMTKDDLERIPETVEAGAIDREYERSVTSAYGQSMAGERTYARPEYEPGPLSGSAAGGAGVASTKMARVDQLNEIEVADYDPDPRGWGVVTADGQRVGKVDHLIGDTEAMRVRYLTVALDDDTSAGRRKVLVPIGYANLDTEDRSVRLDWVESSLIRDLPAYEGTVDRAYTDRLHQTMDRGSGERWYEHPRYSTRRLYGSRRRVD